MGSRYYTAGTAYSPGVFIVPDPPEAGRTLHVPTPHSSLYVKKPTCPVSCWYRVLDGLAYPKLSFLSQTALEVHKDFKRLHPGTRAGPAPERFSMGGRAPML